MTDASNTPSAGVLITQADRNQAADFLERADLLQSATHEHYTQGLMDSSLAVLAFARHRIAHAAPKHERVRADVAPWDIKTLWRMHGGGQHGPIVETYSIEEKAFYRFAADLLALATPPAPGEDVVPPGWRSIDSAPKDGTEVLVSYRAWRPTEPDRQAYVTLARWEWSPDAREDHERHPDDGGFLAINNDWTDTWGGNLMPTHWMPAPDAAKEPAAPSPAAGEV